MQTQVQLLIDNMERNIQTWERIKQEHENMGTEYYFMVSHARAKIETYEEIIAKLQKTIELQESQVI